MFSRDEMAINGEEPSGDCIALLFIIRFGTLSNCKNQSASARSSLREP